MLAAFQTIIHIVSTYAELKQTPESKNGLEKEKEKTALLVHMNSETGGKNNYFLSKFYFWIISLISVACLYLL